MIMKKTLFLMTITETATRNISSLNVGFKNLSFSGLGRNLYSFYMIYYRRFWLGICFAKLAFQAREWQKTRHWLK